MLTKDRPKFYNKANENIHFEFSSDGLEVEIYIGGWFLSSVEVKDISDKAMFELFDV